MLRALTVLLLCQLAGEALVGALGLPVPGPVLGLALLLAALSAMRRPLPWLTDTADGLLKHLSLLFVPASVGLMQHAARLEAAWLPLLAALVISTVAAIAVGAAVFVAVARLTGSEAEGAERKS